VCALVLKFDTLPAGLMEGDKIGWEILVNVFCRTIADIYTKGPTYLGKTNLL
jgi:hypothetical protein